MTQMTEFTQGTIAGDGGNEGTIPARWEDANVEFLIEEWTRRRSFYQLYRNYYEGRHHVITVNERYQVWFSRLIKSLRLNLCENVINALVERLEIVSWDPVANDPVPAANPDTNGQGPDPAQQAVDAFWEYTSGPSLMNEIHESASVEGDSYLLAWNDGLNQMRLWPHSGDEMCVYYSPELPDVPALAIKLWEDGNDPSKRYWRLNVYYADRVERYRTKEGHAGTPPPKATAWRELADAEGGFVTPNPGPVKEVPVAHFTPKRLSNKIGHSDLANAIPVQDALNKSLVDMVVSGEGLALPLRVLVGVQSMPDPETGEMEGPKYDPRSDIWMNIANEQAKLFEASGADVEKLIKSNEHHILNMARVSNIPPERLILEGGGVLSGESRKVAEAPLVKKADTRQQRYSPAWRRAMKLAGHDVIENWGPTVFETEEEKWALAERKIAVGVPVEQVLLETGYTEEQIKDMFTRAQQRQANLGQFVVDQFRNGNDPAGVLNGGVGGDDDL